MVLQRHTVQPSAVLRSRWWRHPIHSICLLNTPYESLCSPDHFTGIITNTLALNSPIEKRPVKDSQSGRAWVSPPRYSSLVQEIWCLVLRFLFRALVRLMIGTRWSEVWKCCLVIRTSMCLLPLFSLSPYLFSSFFRFAHSRLIICRKNLEDLKKG